MCHYIACFSANDFACAFLAFMGVSPFVCAFGYNCVFWFCVLCLWPFLCLWRCLRTFVCAHFRVTLCLLFFCLPRCSLTHFFRHSCVCASCLRLVLVCDGCRCVCICDVHFYACSLGAMPTLIHTHTPSATNPSLRAGTHFP